MEPEFYVWHKRLMLDEGVDAVVRESGLEKFGITKASHPDLDIANLTLEDAQRIAYGQYWAPYLGVQNVRIRMELADTAYNCGHGVAVRCAQEACNLLALAGIGIPLDIDGALGPRTLAQINAWGRTDDGDGPGRALFSLMQLSQGNHYVRLATDPAVSNRAYFARCLRGWTKRLQDWVVAGVNA